MSADPISTHRGEWVPEDLEDLPENARYEIVDGTLLVSPRPVSGHARVAMRLSHAIAAALPDGLEVLAEVEIAMGRTTRSPDLLVVPVLPSRKSFDPAVVVVGAEVESPSSLSQDRILKPHEYARAGIPGFWRIELEPELRFIAYVLRDGVYEGVADATEGTVEIAEPFPITIDVSALAR